MLKRQKPFDLTKYIAIDPTRTTELHLLGFMPEYLWNNKMYFISNKSLVDYLKYDISPKDERIKNIEVKKVEKSELLKIKDDVDFKEKSKKSYTKKKKELAE